MTAWKDLERSVMAALGTRRRGQITQGGWAAGSDDDGTGPFTVEVKRTSRYQLRRAWVDQARRQTKDDGRPWLFVIAEHGERKPVAVVDFAHFCMLARAAGLIPKETARDPLAGVGGSNEPGPTAEDPPLERHVSAVMAELERKRL